MKRYLLAQMIGASTLIAAPAFAQQADVNVGQTDVTVDRPQTNNNTAVQLGSISNEQIAQWLIVDQRHMIELAEYAVQRTQSPDVRELAETIINDHQSLMQSLQQVASNEQRASGQTGVAVDVNSDRTSNRERMNREQRQENRQANRDARDETRRDVDGDRRPLENLADRVERVTERAERIVDNASDAIGASVGDRAATRGNSPWVNLHWDIADQVAREARQDLEGRDGHEFDSAFVGMVVAAHIQEAATLNVLSQRATGELQRTLENARNTVGEHRKHAESTMDKLQKSHR